MKWNKRERGVRIWGKKQEHLFEPDYRRLIERADMIHNGVISFGPYGLPVGNGRLGGPVWEESGSVLSMQLNHTDVFMYNDASANSTDESGCLGQISVDFGGTVLIYRRPRDCLYMKEN